MRPDLQLALLRLDEEDRRELRRQCRGDWDRVTVGEDGMLTVHDAPQRPACPRPPSRLTRLAASQALEQVQWWLAVWFEKVQRQSLVVSLWVLAGLSHACAAGVRWATAEVRTMLAGVVALRRPEPPAGAEPFDWRAVDLHRVAPAIPGLWRDALVASKGFVYREETWARYGVDVQVVASTLARPQQVEMHPLSFSPHARQAVMSFQRADITVILWFRDPAYPQVTAVLVGPLLERGGEPGQGGSHCVCGTRQSVPSSYFELRARLTALGAVVQPDEFGGLAEVTYQGRGVGTVNAGDGVPLAAVHTDWWRTLWWMQAIDQTGRVY